MGLEIENEERKKKGRVGRKGEEGERRRYVISCLKNYCLSPPIWSTSVNVGKP